MTRALRIWALLAGSVVLGLLVALTSGSSPIGLSEVLDALWHPDTAPAVDIVLRLRLPRALAAFVTGALLALAGGLMQILLRNPLADPYVLGLSGGAAVGALTAMLAGLGAIGIDAMAIVGAASSILFVMLLARREFAQRSLAGAVDESPRLLLTGVALAAGWGAVITLLLALAPEARLRGMLFWMMGDLNGAESWVPGAVILALAIVVIMAVGRDLNVLLRGEATAQALGVRTVALRRLVYAVAAVTTALAVTTAGTVGFVGLVVPHALRLVIGNDQRILLPGAALAGGALLLCADTAARTVIAPLQLPVGVITALVGVPAFILLLRRY